MLTRDMTQVPWVLQNPTSGYFWRYEETDIARPVDKLTEDAEERLKEYINKTYPDVFTQAENSLKELETKVSQSGINDKEIQGQIFTGFRRWMRTYDYPFYILSPELFQDLRSRWEALVKSLPEAFAERKSGWTHPYWEYDVVPRVKVTERPQLNIIPDRPARPPAPTRAPPPRPLPPQ